MKGLFHPEEGKTMQFRPHLTAPTIEGYKNDTGRLRKKEIAPTKQKYNRRTLLESPIETAKRIHGKEIGYECNDTTKTNKIQPDLRL